MSYLPRLADDRLAELFRDLPAVSIVGPRACGKTTTALQLIPNIVHLDQKSVALAFRDDADAALRAVGEPVLLDEWQNAPEVLGAVKRAVDAMPGAGRFLLTGSVTARLLTEQWPGTGRITEVRMAPMTVRELQAAGPATSIIDRLRSGDPAQLQPADGLAGSLDIGDYVALAVRSGFPQVADVSDKARVSWLESYRDQVVARDSQFAGRDVNPDKFGRYLEALALHSATVTTTETLLAMTGVSRQTASTYEHLLERLYLTAAVPPWSSRRVQRLVKASKRLLVDAGLMAAIIGEDALGLLFDADLKGRIMETFVAAQLRAELPFAQSRARLTHLRDSNGRREVDFLLEYARGRVVGVEVKASGSVTAHDARHLVWLRDQLGESFAGGVVFHTGAFTRELGDRLVAAPISTCWASGRTSTACPSR
ncbi:MAG: DUF4143 domain-containing protein [Propionibacteriaceae bacterium]|jgi:predicted AAA+ superfamily ATPase|nr:DUF4143 domain-containing protein [Propionibacteriaceae bacterium]